MFQIANVSSASLMFHLAICSLSGGAIHRDRSDYFRGIVGNWLYGLAPLVSIRVGDAASHSLGGSLSFRAPPLHQEFRMATAHLFARWYHREFWMATSHLHARLYNQEFRTATAICVQDSMLLSTEEDARSCFTEHSPLAWALRDVLAFVTATPFAQAWTLFGLKKMRYSWGFLHTIGELWDMLIMWANPRLPKNHYFLATTNSNMPVSTTVLLSSRIPSQDLSMKAYLAGWLHTLKSRFSTEGLGPHGEDVFF
jgi:hypothetical protein